MKQILLLCYCRWSEEDSRMLQMLSIHWDKVNIRDGEILTMGRKEPVSPLETQLLIPACFLAIWQYVYFIMPFSSLPTELHDTC